MIINWVRHKVKDFQDIIANMRSGIADDIPGDEIPDHLKFEVETSATESSHLYRSPVRKGHHSYTHRNTY